MEDTAAVSFAIKAAFAAVNVVVWSGIFLYVLRLSRRLSRIEAAHETRQPPVQDRTP